MITLLLGGIIGFALFIFSITAMLNTITFPRLRQQHLAHQPFVSVLIPARNEANVIAATITALSRQDYPNYEIILLDDHSIDGTAQRAREAAKDFENLSIITGQKLPKDWLGKNWACHQLSQAATGAVLVFTDADVQWRNDGLSCVIGLQQRTKANMLTVWPTQITLTWPERLIVPLMSFAIMAYLPEFMVRLSPLKAFAAANGQCLVFERATYDAIGGHASVRNNVIEDVGMARLTKENSRKLVMADGSGVVSCRMYDGWLSVRDGFAKNILAGHGNSVPFLLASTVFHWLVFVVPILWLTIGLLAGWANLWLPLILTLVGIGLRALTAIATRQRTVDALFMPISVVLMTRIAAQSLWWHYRYGGPRWKGRTIATQKS